MMTTPSPKNARGEGQGSSGGGRDTPELVSGSNEAVSRAPTQLTGRDTEVALLVDRWELAQEGQGQVVLIVGQPGVGKSRLAQTIRRHASKDDSPGAHRADLLPRIVEWRCSQPFQNTELHPAADYFDRSLGLDRLETPSHRFDCLARHLDELELGQPENVALLANLLFLPVDERYPRLGLTPVREREETFHTLRRWLQAQARRRPILFIIEDLHWLDASTLEFLGCFLAETDQDRILTVLTFRPEFEPSWAEAEHHTRLALNPLTRRQVADLMRAEMEASIPDTLIRQLYERTKGVPLLVEEFMRMARESLFGPARAAEGAGVEMPATLQDLVLARIDRVSTSRDVVYLAAAIGREFHYDMLVAVLPIDETQLQRDLAKLAQADIVFPKGAMPRCAYLFKHALVEEALRNAPPEAQRKEFHRRIAETLEARFPKVAQNQPELLARHYTEAGNLDAAISYWARAGLRSCDRFANIEAIHHLEQGLKLLETLEPSAERDLRELELLRPLGTAYIASRGYAAPEVGPIFRRARELCPRVQDPAQLFAVMWGNYAYNIVRGNLRLCADLADEALEFARSTGEPGILLVATFLVGLTRLYRGDFLGAREACEQAIARYDDRELSRQWAARTGEDAGVTLRCYLGLALWQLGFADQALRMSDEAYAIACGIHHPFSIEYALHHAGWLHQHCRLGGPTAAAGEEAIRLAQEQGFPFWQATGTLYRAAGILQMGRLEEGLKLLQQGLDAYRRTGALLAMPYYLGLLGEALIEAGEYEDARRVLDEAQALVEKNDDRFYEAELARWSGELLLRSRGDLQAAEQYFQKALEIARRQRSRAWELRAAMSLARFRRDRRQKDPAALLMSVREGFTEGFATPDLKEAAALIEQFGDERMRDDFAAGVKYVRDCIPAPMSGSVSIDWRYIPASTLGGDTIGYHWLDPDHLAIYLIDVTGHGLDSALLAVTITNVVRSGSLPETEMREPGRVLTKLNQTFQGNQYGFKFFSIWYGVYSPSSRRLTWAGGGHPPSLLLPPGDGAPIILSSTGPLMGALPTVEYAAQSRVIAVGSRLLVFSDGVYEILRDREPVWTLTDCLAFLSERRTGGGSVMDGLLARARQLHGSPQLDDDFSIIEAVFGEAAT